MGDCLSDNANKNPLSIASLNYSGVQQSPYQFYENQNFQQKRLSDLFEKNCSEEYPAFNQASFKWSISKMDKQWHTRFSPLYNKECGISKDGKLMVRSQFEQEWQQNFEKTFKEVEQKIYNKLSSEQIKKAVERDKKQCKIFDYLIFKTLVQHIYNVADVEKGMNSSKYQKYQNQKFDRPFLNQKRKISVTLQNLLNNKIDVFFLQEANQKILGAIRKNNKLKYHIVTKQNNSCSSAILINLKRFHNVEFKAENKRFIQQFRAKSDGKNIQQMLFLNQDSVFQVIGDIIFISVHLSSKKQVNSSQLKAMTQVLQQIKLTLPKYQFIIGADLNGNFTSALYPVKSKGIQIDLSIFPNCEDKKYATVMKKRTMMQVQKHKANELNDGVKDYLFSSLQITHPHIKTIGGKDIKKSANKDLPLLPNSQHPYDHYLVFGTVIQKQKLDKK